MRRYMIQAGASAWLSAAALAAAAEAAGPSPSPLTQGWTLQPLDFSIQKPYDLPVADRYAHDPQTGVHRLWVLRGDRPHSTSSNTAPRCELKFQNYTSGEHMFDADLFVVRGTHSSIMQVFGATQSATTLMVLSHPDGTIRYYDGPQVFKRNAYDTWFNFKVHHNTAGDGELRIYVDDQLVHVARGRGRNTHYFKAGVYSVRNGNRSEVHLRNVRIWRRTGVSLAPRATGAQPRRTALLLAGGGFPALERLAGRDAAALHDLRGRRATPGPVQAAGAYLRRIDPAAPPASR